MAAPEILSAYIKKLGHPLKEIRERSLRLLQTKLSLGWKLEDELSGTRELLEALLAWFYVQQPTLQREALELLLTTIKTKTGTYIVKELGIKSILANLNNTKHKIDSDAVSIYQDIMETLKFLNTVESNENVNIPRLRIPSLTSSEGESSKDSFNLLNLSSSNASSVSAKENTLKLESHNIDGVRVLLLPWVELNISDAKTILLVEDALKLVKSTRRCCRFIRDVFLRDFPPEIFLNRPTIIKSLLAIVDGGHGGRPDEALQVLLCVTKSLYMRLRQLRSLHLVHQSNKVLQVQNDNQDIHDNVNNELAHITKAADVPYREDALAVLKQIPVPIYTLDTMHTVLSMMARNVVLLDADASEVLTLKELNVALALMEGLIKLLLDCVLSEFWSVEHKSKTIRDIAHKSCMVMRLLGDLLTKYRKSFNENPNKTHHRTAWIRLVSCAESLLSWCGNSALPPSSLVVALQAASIDPALQLLYPEVNEKISAVLQVTRITGEQDYKNKYKHLLKLYESMEYAAKFMKNTKSCRNSKGVLNIVKMSLPALELHLNEGYLNDVADILLYRSKDFDFDDNDWSIARSITLNLMVHNIEWVRVKFYRMLMEMVKSVVVGSGDNGDSEKCLILLCDVGILTEICCHGLCSKDKEIESAASDIMLYLLRGRLALSDGCWWKLLASLLPVFPLLHVYAEHSTQLGQAICKSLERDIAECMGVSAAETATGLSRLLFVPCASAQADAARALCRIMASDEDKYLPPRDLLRTDILINALKRVQPQDFNVDYSTSPSKTTQMTGLLQMLEVLKQDIIIDEHGTEMVSRANTQPSCEPSVRRSTLQQLTVMLRKQDTHDTFLQNDGVKLIVAILRMSLMVDDYLAFPECAISCVSILNSVGFACRHALAKIPDLPLLLLRVILVFPANESAVLMSAQVLALTCWSGFALQELDSTRRRVPALPRSVVERTCLPFVCNSYWNTSPNAGRSIVDWLLVDEAWRAAVRVRWWVTYEGGAKALYALSPPPAPLALRPSARDLEALRAACPKYTSTKGLLALENATSHRQVLDALCELESAISLLPLSSASIDDLMTLPWHNTRRFLSAAPGSSRDANLLTALLQFLIVYMDCVPNQGASMSWIRSFFLESEGSVVSILSRHQLFPQQTAAEDIEVTQLHISIVRVLLRCVIVLETNDFSCSKMESLLKIILACLERIDLKNFHMLGYLNELMRCTRYIVNSRYSQLSEHTLLDCMRVVTKILTCCASGGGRKGQACRVDALLTLLPLLKQVDEENIPVQRWSEYWGPDTVRVLMKSEGGASAESRAAALQATAALACYAQLLPQLTQAVPNESLIEYALEIYAQRGEANIVRAAAANLICSVTARVSPKTEFVQQNILKEFGDKNFVEVSLEILLDFFKEKNYENYFEPNVPLALLDRRSELEVRAQKSEVHVSPTLVCGVRPPPTASLVASLAGVVRNVSAFAVCPLGEWSERGLYRLLFRITSWNSASVSDMHCVRASSCSALHVAARHKCVRTSLANTNDCLHELLATLTPLSEDDVTAESISARKEALLLLSALLSDKTASSVVWQALRDERSMPFFQLLLQTLETGEQELEEAGLYCLTQLIQSGVQKKHVDRTKDHSYIQLFDNLNSPFDGPTYKGAGDNAGDCQPEYIAEELCKSLMDLFNRVTLDHKQHESGEDDRWTRIASCLSSVLAASPRCRSYSVHRRLPRTLLAALASVRDHLSLQGKPAELVRHMHYSPVLRTLQWLLTLITCSMLNNLRAKEQYAEDNMAATLLRLWPWTMLNEPLRDTVVQLLLVYSNGCEKAWASLCACAGARSLAHETSALAVRAAAPRLRPALLARVLHTLRHCVPHCRARHVILQSDVLPSIHAVCIKEHARGGSLSPLGAWARLCSALCRHADGACAVLALRPGAAPPRVRAPLLPALAHSAHLCRLQWLQTPQLLELLSGCLLVGDLEEMVSAGRAVWALAANNHKAKLLLRSAGVVAAVHSALQRLDRFPKTEDWHRAKQLLTYTDTVVQTS